jgi:hypothetical protein
VINFLPYFGGCILAHDGGVFFPFRLLICLECPDRAGIIEGRNQQARLGRNGQ